MRLIFTILFLSILSVNGQTIRCNPFYNIAQVSLFLDLYPSSSSSFSLRKLSSIYSGNCIRVRRSNDNTEQNIGFSGNYLDTASMKTFVGANNGFVTTWYDQSGNGNDVSQATLSQQPQIISSGSVLYENGKVAINFDGSNDFLSMTNLALLNNINKAFILSVAKVNGGDGNRSIFMATTPNSATARFCLLGLSTTTFQSGGRRLDANGYQSVDGTTGSYGLVGGFADYANAKLFLYQNGVSYERSGGFQTSGSTSATNSSQIRIGARSTTGDRLNGRIQEVILYTSDQSGNRSGMESNINSFYSIY